MGGLFGGGSTPTYTPPPPPTAPIDEATFKAGSDETDTAKKERLKLGKKRLQIPTSTTTATTATGLNTGA